jgi:two-component system, cell cycle sensor histidine kinase and response regulator CckA
MAASDFQSELRNILFRCNPVPMFLYDNRSLRILAANDSAAVRYGYTFREFRSMTLAGLRPSGDSPALDQPPALDPDAPQRALWTHATKQGKHFLVELRAVPFPHCSRRLRLLSAIGVTPCREARQKLVHTARLNRTLVEECPFGIYRFNLNTRRYEHANPALLNLLGYTLQEFCNLDQPSFFPDLSEREAYLDDLRATGNIRDIETRLRSRDGRLVCVSISCSLFDSPDTGDQCVLAYVRDITRQHDLEEQLDHAHRMEAVGRFAGGIAHDFNNITQSISLSCELALHAPLPPSVQSKLYGILDQATRAAEITQQLLAFSRLQLLQPRVINLNDCIRQALAMLHRALGDEISIDLHLDETLAPIVIDPDQLTLVLMHLAENARAAMPKGGTLRISTAPAPLATEPPNGAPSEPCVVLTVADTGIGMDEPTRRRIFEPFFSTKTTTQTTGLGLSTVHGIVHQSKGHIECESAPGHGATFRIFLPIATILPAAAPPDRRCRILLAEDDALVNKHLTQALKEAGFSVHPVRNGEEALAAFARQPFQIVVTDIVMPKLSGVELTRRLRQLAPTLPIVLISGYSEQIPVLQNLPHNQIAFLQKPFASPTLIAIIRNLLAASGPQPPDAGGN